MIKHKTLDIKIINKTYLKTLKRGYKHFNFSNRLLFYKIFKNNFQKLLFKIVLKNVHQIGPKFP